MKLPDLMSIKGIGEKRYESMLAIMEAQSLQLAEVYQMKPDEIRAAFKLPLSVAEAVACADQQPVSGKDDKSEMPSRDVGLTEKDVRILYKSDAAYPKKLLQVLGDAAPEPLYVWGNLDLLTKPSVGFCGSRNVSDKGLNITADITRQISKKGWVTVSGHARGVDVHAHRVALESGAETIIVLPEGIDGFKLRVELRRFVSKSNVLIISEFSPTAGWAAGRAMQRNSTIIGLSDAMVLVESREKGGTFSAGKTALKLKHPLFVVDFKQEAASNVGNKHFIQQGAIKIGKNPVTHLANIEPLSQRVEYHFENGHQNVTAKQIPLFDE